MKYKVGDRVRIKSLDWYNENKSKSHGTVACGGKYFDYDMREWCGKTMTILTAYQTCYIMQEDGAKDLWTDEMIEGLVEEKPQSKFNIGDVVYSQAYQRNVIIKEIRPYRLYKVGDLLSTWWLIAHEDTLCKEIVKSTNEYTLPDGYIFKDENGNVINAQKIVLEKKKKEYPKTYKECVKILGLGVLNELKHDSHNIIYRIDLIASFQKLLICRDAYWKIAGEEMGLGKPWKPDWNIRGYYAIARSYGNVVKTSNYNCDLTFVFPTPEMRDAFKENFGPDIEICKELF